MVNLDTSMLKEFLVFSLLFALSLTALYFIHIYSLKGFLPEKELNLVNFSYPFNFIISYLTISLIVAARKKLKDQLAFVFMAGGIFKFVLFIALLKTTPLDIDKSNFFDFFVPYLACLGVEIFCLFRILNKQKPNKTNR
jgi:hypothetical protein